MCVQKSKFPISNMHFRMQFENIHQDSKIGKNIWQRTLHIVFSVRTSWLTIVTVEHTCIFTTSIPWKFSHSFTLLYIDFTDQVCNFTYSNWLRAQTANIFLHCFMFETSLFTFGRLDESFWTTEVVHLGLLVLVIFGKQSCLKIYSQVFQFSKQTIKVCLLFWFSWDKLASNDIINKFLFLSDAMHVDQVTPTLNTFD